MRNPMKDWCPDGREQSFEFETTLGEEVVNVVGREAGRFTFEDVIVEIDGNGISLHELSREEQKEILEDMKEYCDELYQRTSGCYVPPGRDPAEWD